MYWLNFILVTICVAVTNIFWIFYFIKIEEAKAFSAALWSSLIILLSAFSVSHYSSDKTFVLAGALGAFIGTFCSIQYKKIKLKNKNKDGN
jgi:hypothetical protein